MTEVSYRCKNWYTKWHEFTWNNINIIKSGNNENISLNSEGEYEKSVSIKYQYASYGINNTVQNISWRWWKYDI